MRLAPPELEISDDEGFVPERDIFGRREFAQRLTNLVSSIEGPGVLLLDAPWGSGKSTFVKMWRGELKQRQIPSVYFDAFSNDYQADAFLAMASEILAVAKTSQTTNQRNIDKFKSGALKVAKVLAVSGAKLAVKAATLGVVGGEDLKDAAADLVKATGEEAANQVEGVIKKRLESHDDDKQAFEAFRQALTDLAKGITDYSIANDEEGDGEQSTRNPRPLVFIIDELDRCKPPFALDLLEKIKHFFAVDGVAFLLVSSFPQLLSAVKYAYGDIDAMKYLEKFYHLRVLLPSQNPARKDLGVETYLRYLGCDSDICETVSFFSRVTSIQFRTLERIASYSNVALKSFPPENTRLRVPYLLPMLCLVKVLNPELYSKMRAGEANYLEAYDFFQFSLWRDPAYQSSVSSYVSNIDNFLKVVLNGVLDEQTRQTVSERFLSGWGSPANAFFYHCDLIDGFQFPSDDHS